VNTSLRRYSYCVPASSFRLSILTSVLCNSEAALGPRNVCTRSPCKLKYVLLNSGLEAAVFNIPSSKRRLFISKDLVENVTTLSVFNKLSLIPLTASLNCFLFAKLSLLYSVVLNGTPNVDKKLIIRPGVSNLTSLNCFFFGKYAFCCSLYVKYP